MCVVLSWKKIIPQKLSIFLIWFPQEKYAVWWHQEKADKIRRIKVCPSLEEEKKKPYTQIHSVHYLLPPLKKKSLS